MGTVFDNLGKSGSFVQANDAGTRPAATKPNPLATINWNYIKKNASDINSNSSTAKQALINAGMVSNLGNGIHTSDEILKSKAAAQKDFDGTGIDFGDIDKDGKAKEQNKIESLFRGADNAIEGFYDDMGSKFAKSGAGQWISDSLGIDEDTLASYASTGLDLGTDIGLMALGPAGIALGVGKSALQQGNELSDAVDGTDSITGRELTEAERLAKGAGAIGMIGFSALGLKGSGAATRALDKQGVKILDEAGVTADDMARSGLFGKVPEELSTDAVKAIKKQTGATVDRDALAKAGVPSSIIEEMSGKEISLNADKAIKSLKLNKRYGQTADEMRSILENASVEDYVTKDVDAMVKGIKGKQNREIAKGFITKKREELANQVNSRGSNAMGTYNDSRREALTERGNLASRFLPEAKGATDNEARVVPHIENTNSGAGAVLDRFGRRNFGNDRKDQLLRFRKQTPEAKKERFETANAANDDAWAAWEENIKRRRADEAANNPAFMRKEIADSMRQRTRNRFLPGLGKESANMSKSDYRALNEQLERQQRLVKDAEKRLGGSNIDEARKAEIIEEKTAAEARIDDIYRRARQNFSRGRLNTNDIIAMKDAGIDVRRLLTGRADPSFGVKSEDGIIKGFLKSKRDNLGRTMGKIDKDVLSSMSALDRLALGAGLADKAKLAALGLADFEAVNYGNGNGLNPFSSIDQIPDRGLTALPALAAYGMVAASNPRLLRRNNVIGNYSSQAAARNALMSSVLRDQEDKYDIRGANSPEDLNEYLEYLSRQGKANEKKAHEKKANEKKANEKKANEKKAKAAKEKNNRIVNALINEQLSKSSEQRRAKEKNNRLINELMEKELSKSSDKELSKSSEQIRA